MANSRLKIYLGQTGLRLTKGETYRIEVDENLVYETASPILLPNAQNDALVEWTAAGIDAEDVTIASAGLDKIIISFPVDVNIFDSGDYITENYFNPGYISGDLGTIELYGEDSTSVDTWNFPHDAGIEFNSRSIAVTSASALTELDTYYISIPADIIEDTVAISNEEILNLDFVYDPPPVTTIDATITSSASIDVEAQKFKSFTSSINTLGAFGTDANSANVGATLGINSLAFITNVDGSPNYGLINKVSSASANDYIHESNPVYATRLSEEHALVQYTSSGNNIVGIYHADDSSTITWFNVYSDESNIPIEANTISLYTTDSIEISPQSFIAARGSTASKFLVGQITGESTVVTYEIDKPSGAGTTFANQWNVSDDYYVCVDNNGKIYIYDTDDRSLVNSISTGLTSIIKVAISNNNVYVIESAKIRGYNIISGSSVLSVDGGSNTDIHGCDSMIGIARGIDSVVYKTIDHTVVKSSFNALTIAVHENAIAAGNSLYDDGTYTDRGIVTSYH